MHKIAHYTLLSSALEHLFSKCRRAWLYADWSCLRRTPEILEQQVTSLTLASAGRAARSGLFGTIGPAHDFHRILHDST